MLETYAPARSFERQCFLPRPRSETTSRTKSRGSASRMHDGANFFLRSDGSHGREGERRRAGVRCSRGSSRPRALASGPVPAAGAVFRPPRHRRRTSAAMHGRIAVNPNAARYVTYPGAYPAHPTDLSAWESRHQRDRRVALPGPSRHAFHYRAPN